MTEIARSEKAKAAALLGVPVGCGTLGEITARSLHAIATHSRLTFACANPHSLVVAQQEPAFLAALKGTDLLVADGVGVKLAADLLGIDVGPRITGFDYFSSLLRAMDGEGGGRVFFFGSSEHVLGLVAQRFARDFPRLTLCGTLSPPYGTWSAADNERMLRQINEARPDVLWVGMTAPKQELWVETNRQQIEAHVIGSIGAVFDFFAGTYPRAPEWMCRTGLEWVYRLVREPRRMWRRTFVSAPRFFREILSQHLLS